jgi:thiol-disulfide isomerase/thioredoxin
MARLRPALVAVVSTVLVLAGCGADQPEAGSPPASTQPSTSPASSGDDATTGTPTDAAPAPTVPERLRFTANTVDGKDFSGESLAGRPAVLWFWAPWCPKCNAEAPTIAEAARTAGNVAFVGVAAQDELSAMREFVQKHDLGSFPHLADTDAAVWQRFGVTYQPAYAFVSSDGTIEMETDQLDKDDLLARVGALT